jgi:hypothetical protein
MNCIKEFAVYKEISQEVSKVETLTTKDNNSVLVKRLRIHFWNNFKTFTFCLDYNINDYIQFERDYKLKELGL